MKILTYIGLSIGALAAIAGVYDYTVVNPDKEIAESTLFADHPESFYGSSEQEALWEIADFGTDFAIGVMGLGLLGFLVSIVPAIKKQKIAWVGVILSLVGFFIGAAYGTHMFS